MHSKWFDIEIDEKEYVIRKITDKRYAKSVDITDGKGDFGTYTYTFKQDDITKGKKPYYTPYVSRKGEYNAMERVSPTQVIFKNTEHQTQVRYEMIEQGIKIELETTSQEYSEFGINLPLNFMSKKNGEWQEQFLISSPYDSQDNQYHFCYFTSPDGNNLLVVAVDQAVGFKIDYSEYICGHFFENFKYLTSFDKAYNYPVQDKNKLTLYLLPVQTYEEALEHVHSIYQVPIAKYETATGFIGDTLELQVLGECDHLEAVHEKGERVVLAKVDGKYKLSLTAFGLWTIVPYYKGKKGLDCSVFAIDQWDTYYKRITDSVHQNYDKVLVTEQVEDIKWEPPGLVYVGNADNPDKNLCESQIWAFSALRYMRLYGREEKIERDVKNLLYFVMTDRPELYLERLTIVAEQQPGTESYHTHLSTRIQEVFSGVSLLIDAYRVFGDRSYLEYAIKAMQAMIKWHVLDTGEIRRYGYGNKAHFEDYTTVSCLVTPIVDLANELKAQNDIRYKVFEEAAIRIADYVVQRGLHFPTEGGVCEHTNTEVEEGSMSCTALTVMYVAQFIRYKPEYLTFAKKILETHDAFTMHTMDPRLYRSTLRWWETIWEGDYNGPAICCGHAWTIWRGEAEFYYGLLAQDSKRLKDSYSAYMTNFATTDAEGNMYSMYTYDYIVGGGDYNTAEEMVFKISKGFPNRVDWSLSRFVFARSYDTWFRCTAIIGEEVLNGRMEENIIRSYAPRFEVLYLDVPKGCYRINTNCALQIIAVQPIQVTHGMASALEREWTVTPEQGCIEINIE